MKRKLKSKNKYRRMCNTLIVWDSSHFKHGDVLGYQGVKTMYRVHEVLGNELKVYTIS